jgi:hypothetical protein
MQRLKIRKSFIVLFCLLISIFCLSNFSFASEEDKEHKFNIGISSNYWGPEKPNWWGGGGELGPWEENGIKGKFYDKQNIFSLLLEYKLDPNSSLSLSYPVKEYEGDSSICVYDIENYDNWGNFLGTFDWTDSNALKITPINLNYLRYFKKDSSPYLGLGIGLYKVELINKSYTSPFTDPSSGSLTTVSGIGKFSQNRIGYEFIGGYEFKINKNFSVDFEVKYQKVEKIKGKMKKIWSTGTEEERTINDLIYLRNNDISGLVYGLKIKYMF